MSDVRYSPCYCSGRPLPPAQTQEPAQGKGALPNSIGIKLLLIPAGEFLMGSPDDDKQAFDWEKPQHRVRITRPFYLGTTEVTRGQFRRFVEATGYRTEAERDGEGGRGWNEETGRYERDTRYSWKYTGFQQTDEHPVVNVTWNDAVAFCKWLSGKEHKAYRLPTEAEWEYTCRAGTTTRFSCGDHLEGVVAVGNVADGNAKAKYPDWRTIAAPDGVIYTAPVGRYKPNAWGLYDMHGNVCEWCGDRYDIDYYGRSPVEDPRDESGASDSRVTRGGSWSHHPGAARSAYRNWDTPRFPRDNLGFRVAREAAGT
jgi:formylglycine-generating enzyme